jgi:fructokinase
MSSERREVLVGAIEAGGTKFVCAVGRGPEDLQRPENRISFPTGDNPARVLSAVITWFKSREATVGRLAAIGIASFGPIDLDESSRTYGRITSTPKQGWQNADLLGMIRSEFPGLPIGFDTDVNGAGLGEHLHGAAVGLDDFVYITLGTGIGAGGMARGQLLHGLIHPEMGHMRLPRLPGDTFAGVCPYHGDCWEGLCSGPSLAKRTGVPAEQLPPSHEAWAQLTKYVGIALANLVYTLSPKRIIIGGSVRKGGQLGEAEFFKRVRAETRASLNGYVVSPMILTEAINGYIVPPKLGDDAGICGAIALGQWAR